MCIRDSFSNACDELGARRNAVIGAAEAGDIDRAIDLYSNEYLAQKEVTVNLSTEVVNNAEHVAQAFVKDSFSVEVGTSLAIGLLGTAAIVLVIVMWRRITVSYTHLDVYKRQGVSRSTRAFRGGA